MDFDADIAIVGAGVVGLAVAAEAARPERDVYVLEQHDSFGRETSSRNSEVIHAGIYYPPDSLKARLCVQGRDLLYEYCARARVPHRRIAKLIVATAPEELETLHAYFERGRTNGAGDLRLLSKQEAARLEPHVRAEEAILSPLTGIVDSHGLMRSFEREAKEKGAVMAYNSRVTAIEKLTGPRGGVAGYQVAVDEGPRAEADSPEPGESSPGPRSEEKRSDEKRTFTFRTRILVNCAGLGAERIARLAGIDTAAAGYRLHPCKGEYFSVRSSKAHLVDRLVYPLPFTKTTDLGIHVTFDLQGRMRLGPNARFVETPPFDPVSGELEWDYSVDESQKRTFFESARRFLPFLELEDLEPDMAGIRPKLQEPGGEVRDFVIRHEEDRGLPGLIDLIGIESPGLTAAPAIAKRVAATIDEIED